MKKEKAIFLISFFLYKAKLTKQKVVLKNQNKILLETKQQMNILKNKSLTFSKIFKVLLFSRFDSTIPHKKNLKW